MGLAAAIGVGAVASVGSAAIGASASKKASKASAQSAAEANALQGRIYDENKTILSPFVQAGRPATDRLNALLGLSGQPAQQQAFGGFRDYLDQSGYAFDLGRGLDAVNAGYAGKGMIKSGAAMKGIEDYRQGIQNQYLGNYMGLLGGQQGLGLSAGSALAGVGQNYANNAGQIAMQNGANQANAALVRGQNTAGALNSFANTAGSILGQQGGTNYARLTPSVNDMIAANPGLF